MFTKPYIGGNSTNIGKKCKGQRFLAFLYGIRNQLIYILIWISFLIFEFLFFLLLEQFIPDSFQQNRCIVDALHTDACAAAADGPVSRDVVHMSEEVGVGHAAADVQRLVREHEETSQYDRKIITLFKSQFPPFLRRQVEVVISHHKIFVTFEEGEQFTAAVFALRAEISQMIDEVVVRDGLIPPPDHLMVHFVCILKRALLVETDVLVAEMGVGNDVDPGGMNGIPVC